MATATLATTEAVRARDGRLVTFSAAGAHDGFPIVYCHGAIGSPRWRTPELDALVQRLGLRYLVVNRPGFGGSDPSPERTVAGFAADVEDLMDELGCERFSVVGVSAGAPYALACGWALRERVVALVAASPLVPAHGAGGSTSLRYRIPAVPFGTPHAGPAVAGLWLRALRLSGETPADAMIDDYRVCRRRWGFDATEVGTPVTLWHGARDPLVPLSHVRTLAAALPGSLVRVDPGGGHFFYSRRLPDIVGALLPAITAAAERSGCRAWAPPSRRRSPSPARRLPSRQ
jgi:pimeloyl-ACP methyl ester carboxylesterase